MYHCISHGNCMLHRFHGNKAHHSQGLNCNARGREETNRWFSERAFFLMDMHQDLPRNACSF